jgi:DNA-binding response OmpR family regulator
MGNLRKKLEDDTSHPRYLETVRGVGFRFAAHPG